MTAREKIEKLSNGWYGFTLFAGIATLLQNGIGFFSLLFGGMSVLFSLFVCFLVTRWLLSRSSTARFIVLCFAGIGLCLGAVGTFFSATTFLAEWSFTSLIQTVVVAAGVLMHFRSLRTLTDDSVKSWYRG